MFSIRYNSRVKSRKNKKRSARVTKIKPFLNKYIWKGINIPSEKKDWKNEKNNVVFPFNVSYV